MEITIDISDPTEARSSTKLLKIEPSRWDQFYSVRFTGVDDLFDDGSVPYNVTFTMDSSDPAFAAAKHSAKVIECFNLDDDVSEILVSFGFSGPGHNSLQNKRELPTSFFQSTTEGTAGKWLPVFVQLSSQPTDSVELDIRSHDLSEGLLSKNQIDVSSNIQLKITPQLWNVSQTIYVMGVDDDIADGDQHYEVSFTPATNDATYVSAGIMTKIANYDDDFASVFVDPQSGNLDTSESAKQRGQHSWTFEVKLATQPLSPVIIHIKSSDTTEGKVSKKQIEFPAGTGWNKIESVRVSGVDDDLVDGDQEFEVLFEIESSDEDYGAIILDSLKSTNLYVDGVGVSECVCVEIKSK